MKQKNWIKRNIGRPKKNKWDLLKKHMVSYELVTTIWYLEFHLKTVYIRRRLDRLVESLSHFSLREILFKVNEVSCERRVVVKHESFLFKKRCYWLPLQRRRSWHVSGSSHQRFSIKKVFLKVSQKSQKNTRPGVSFFNKIAGVSPATLLKRDSSTGYFLQKFLRTLFLPNISEWLVLYFTSWGTDRLYNVMMMMMMMISWYSRVKKK